MCFFLSFDFRFVMLNMRRENARMRLWDCPLDIIAFAKMTVTQNETGPRAKHTSRANKRKSASWSALCHFDTSSFAAVSQISRTDVGGLALKSSMLLPVFLSTPHEPFCMNHARVPHGGTSESWLTNSLALEPIECQN